MRWSILLMIACGSISGCHIETRDCGDDDRCCRGPWDEEPVPQADAGNWSNGAGARRGSRGGSGGSAETGGASAGSGGTSTGTGGTSSGTGGTSTGTGGTSGDTGGAPNAMPCTVESDCARGYNCDTTRGECVPTDAETCPELTTEASCSARKDCTTVYAGTNCTCGPDCQCTGGEPGCICERFEFFRCVAIQ